jgi:hypothetical protein
MKATIYIVSITNMHSGETSTKAYFREKQAVDRFYKACNDLCYSWHHIIKWKDDYLHFATAGGEGYDYKVEISHQNLYI